MNAHHSPARGAWCELASLIGNRLAARSLDLGQRRRALSALAGAGKTSFRGRGIEFEEVRNYQAGDDIRTIDWRVTARTGDAHTKLFREERERPVMVVVDQGPGMFFGSCHCTKSVLAAELASLIAWAALQGGDRLGGLVFSGDGHREVRPRRSRRSVLALLRQLAAMNRLLPAAGSPRQHGFAEALTETRRIIRPGSSLFIISDFANGASEAALEQLYPLSRHLEITALRCTDPLERQLPPAGNYTVTDGENHLAMDTGDAELRHRFTRQYTEHSEALHAAYARLGIPVLELSTEQTALDRLQHYYHSRQRNKR